MIASLYPFFTNPGESESEEFERCIDSLNFGANPSDEELRETHTALVASGKNQAVERESEIVDELFRGLQEELMAGQRRVIPLAESQGLAKQLEKSYIASYVTI